MGGKLTATAQISHHYQSSVLAQSGMHLVTEVLQQARHQCFSRGDSGTLSHDNRFFKLRNLGKGQVNARPLFVDRVCDNPRHP